MMPGLLIKGRTILFSDCDADFVFARKWSIQHHGGGRLYVYGWEKPRGAMHRLLLQAPKGLRVDHRNGNGLDNRRENIRLCDAAQNGWNAGARRGRFKGVNANMGGFRASIRCRGAVVYCGWAKTEEAAARLYDLKAIELHGEFARLNFPREDYGSDAAQKYGKRPLLTPDEVSYILTCGKSLSALAAELGWSKSLISKVRNGGGRYAAVSTEHMAEAVRRLA